MFFKVFTWTLCYNVSSFSFVSASLNTYEVGIQTLKQINFNIFYTNWYKEFSFLQNNKINARIASQNEIKYRISWKMFILSELKKVI